ncbi:MAG: rod shape-determining protein MreC [Deltaproteobacteria bacterium]|nr:rod shape-determining protein MreC [Deltaproteobacteria bacterium]
MKFLKNRAVLITIVLFFVSIQLFSLNIREKRSQNFISSIVLTITYYPQKLVYIVSDKILNTWQDYMDLVDVRQENIRLNKEVLSLRQDKFELAEARIQNYRLKKLLDFKESPSYPIVSANVIGGSPSLLRKEVIIVDRGTRDGISQGMPVASSEGIVGRVLSVGDRSSEVLLITDPVSAVDAFIHRTRVRGIVKGTGGGCAMEYIEQNSDISIGDKVISSGKEGFFPKGVIIGTVSNIETKGSFISAQVSPFVDLDSLEEVVIILKTNNNIVLNE